MKHLPWLFWILLSSCHLMAQDAEMQWVKGIGATPFEQVQAIVADDSGHVYVTGSFYGTLDFDPGPGTSFLTSAGNTDVFVQKLNGNGELVWVYRLGGVGNDTSADLLLDGSGNLYLLGNFSDNVDFDPGPGTLTLNEADGSMFVQRVTPGGDLIWARQWGGAVSEQAESMTIGPSDNLVVTGHFRGVAEFDPGPGSFPLTSANDDIFLLSLSSAGTLIWAIQIGGPSDDVGIDVMADRRGNLYLLGQFDQAVDLDPGPGSFVLDAGIVQDLCVIKFSQGGTFRWAYQLGGDAPITGVNVGLQSDTVLYCSGRFRGVMDADPGPDSLMLHAGAGRAFFCQTVDSAGQLRWAQTWGHSPDADLRSMVVDTLGRAFFTGSFSDTLDMAPGPGRYLLNSLPGNLSSPSADIFLQSLDAQGQFVWAKQAGGSGFDLGTSLALGPDESLFQAGGFNATAQFDPYQSGLTLTSGGNTDAFVGQWQFTNNPPVFPGDANDDGIADFLDIMPLGGFFGDVGPLRPSASLAWVPQTAPVWGMPFALTGADAKHSDSNGDGEITFADTLAIWVNYGLTHGLYVPDSTLLPNLGGLVPITLVGPPVLQPGDTVALALHFGSNDSVANQAYGLAVELGYDTTLMDIIGFHFDGSWFGQKGVNLMTLAREDSLQAKFQISMIGTDQASRSGFGQVATIIVVVSDDIAKQTLPLTFQFLRVQAVDDGGNVQSLSVLPDPFALAIDTSTTALMSRASLPALRWTHDPAQQQVLVEAEQPLTGWLSLYDAQGRVLRRLPLAHTTRQVLSLAQMPPGMYLLRVAAEPGGSSGAFRVMVRGQ
jgi:hypothetical protein